MSPIVEETRFKDIFWFSQDDGKGVISKVYYTSPRDSEGNPHIMKDGHNISCIRIMTFTKEGDIPITQYIIPVTDFAVFFNVMERLKKEQYENLLKAAEKK